MRRVFRLGLVGILGIAAALVLIGFWTWENAAINVSHDGDRELRIPLLLDPPTGADGVRTYDLALQGGETELVPGGRAYTWGFNGSYLGPTLRARRGDRVRLRVQNTLEEQSSVHWHGMHLPAEADGGPHQPIEPGETWQPSWTIDQPAATLWYHPHLHGTTADHVYRGLAGMWIVDDPRAAVGLPSDYGVDDVPVIVQDKRLRDDGDLDMGESSLSPIGRLGSTLLVNGTYRPYFDVGTQKVRLRLLNAANARTFRFELDDSSQFELVATDGGLLRSPVATDEVQLSPGERAEIVVTMQPGETRKLRSVEPDLGTGAWNGRFSGADDSFDVLELRAARTLEPSPETPQTLAPADEEASGDFDRAPVRQFELRGVSINGLRMDMRRVDQVVALNRAEVWEVRNSDGIPHNFHAHDTRFKVLSVDGRRPDAELSGLKDTVYVPPGSTMRLAVRFTDYADPATPYMFHCHLLRHEDLGMMGQFVVVAPGQRPSVPLPKGDHARH